MENTTFSDDSLINKLNQHFYFVKLDAETSDSITYSGHTFKFRPTGANTGVHELAEQLGTIDGKLNYPTLTILNRSNEIVFQYSGVLEADALLAGLNKLVH
jgi:thioredoxin-related protein